MLVLTPNTRARCTGDDGTYLPLTYFTPQEAGPSQAAAVEEPEPEPEPDPVAEAFADMGMAPVITKTKRHMASNPWAERGPVSSSLAMAMDDDGGGAGWEDAGDTLDLRAERRRQVRVGV